MNNITTDIVLIYQSATASKTASLLAECLKRGGFDIIQTDDTNIESLLLYKEAQNFDLCVLDYFMGDIKDLSLIKKLREIDQYKPIIFMADFLSEGPLRYKAKVEAYNAGADDCITRPFQPEEFLCKVQSLLRRYRERRLKYMPKAIQLGNYAFNSTNNVLTYIPTNDNLRLSNIQGLILGMLIMNIGQFVSTKAMLKKIWGKEDGDDYWSPIRSFSTALHYLRQALSSDPRIRIQNRHNIGYILYVDDDYYYEDLL